jgi:hypothetical protein
MPLSFTRTLRLKVRREAYAWLNAAAIEVNEVYNYCNETSYNAARRTDIKRKWLTGFDLCNLTVGASQYFDKIGADTIQSICVQYAQKRAAARRVKLRWRASRGTRRAAGLTWAIEWPAIWAVATGARKEENYTSRRHLSIPRGTPVSSLKLVRTRMAKSVLDSGWGMLKNFLEYKSQQAARGFEVVSERNTSVTCSACVALSGPRGVNGLIVRSWVCCHCGEWHDRDVNAARNILIGSRYRTSVRGNEPSHWLIPPSDAYRVREAGIETARAAA